MKTVLVVDDDQVILQTIVAYLSSFSEELAVVTADDGRQALSVLETQPVDLLLTDLDMPVMDGFELLAHMVRAYATIPCIVMSAYEVPELGDRVGTHGAVCYLEKPFDLQSLVDTVLETLGRVSKGHLAGVSLLGFLQLLHFEKKSCLLTVRSAGRSGRIHVMDGDLINADFHRLQGESAVFEILSWADCEIDVSAPHYVERLIFRPLHGVVLDAARDLDERPPSASRSSDSGISTQPINLGEDGLGQIRLQLPRMLEQSSMQEAGAVGVAVVDIQMGELLGYRCFQYWPDFSDRAMVTAASFRRRLELDDGEQVDEVLTRLEALLELWRPLGRDRRRAFYVLMTRQEVDLDVVREQLKQLESPVKALLKSSGQTA
ncbi:MAG: response regulator [Acidobacteriota bacterium]